MPQLQQQGADVFFVSTGSAKDLSKWQEFTQFPAHKAFMDPQALLYKSLKTRKGIFRSLLHPYMWCVVGVRKLFNGDIAKVKAAAKVWKPVVPDNKEASWLQGGLFVFRGPRLLWAHYDATPGDYADRNEVMAVVGEALGAPAPHLASLRAPAGEEETAGKGQ